jgi:hypothetical protein
LGSGFFYLLPITFLCLIINATIVNSFTNEEMAEMQSIIRNRPVGERIVFWAEKFIGTPYDKDPQGDYVTKKTIIADERVDCMYLVFRSVELAISNNPEETITAALDKRFHTRGILVNGLVANYEDRFEYGEDMIDSGKWGTEITAALGKTTPIKDDRNDVSLGILSTGELKKALGQLQSGDLIFFIKNPAKRVRDEFVGHMGIIKLENAPKDVQLLHAGGTKAKGGLVNKVLLTDYLKTTPYIGARITRLNEEGSEKREE